LPNLVVRGLMAIPPPGSHESNRPHFASLRRLRDRLNDLRLPNAQLKELSMGMSSDFEGAIQEGATMVRVGTEIFGPRSGRRG
ncbi:MAG: YggS family pyridoxal phosphate-dependent enzyme, partial [Candidatus Binatia bacterium]